MARLPVRPLSRPLLLSAGALLSLAALFACDDDQGGTTSPSAGATPDAGDLAPSAEGGPDAARSAPDAAADDGGLQVAPSVAVSSGFSCALRPSGDVYCWGNATAVGVEVEGGAISPPGTVATLSDAVRIGAGALFACALTREGEVRCWGRNLAGQTGQPIVEVGVSRPKLVPGLADVIDLAVGYDHACALKRDRSVWCWGANKSYQLGHVSSVDPDCNGKPCSAVPTRVEGLSADAVTAGDGFTCARVGTGARCWGTNQWSSLGHPPGQLGDVVVPGVGTVNATPTTASATGIAALFSGAGTTCMLTAAGASSCWGDDRTGQLGDQGAAAPGSPVPLAIVGLPTPTTQLAPANDRACAVSNGRLDCWGRAVTGIFGKDAGSAVLPPTRIAFPDDATIVSVSHSHASGHQCAVAADSSVYCWGLNLSGETGRPNTTDPECGGITCTPSPTKVPLP